MNEDRVVKWFAFITERMRVYHKWYNNVSLAPMLNHQHPLPGFG